MFAWLDELLRAEVRTMRAAYAKPIEEFQGLYMSDASVDHLLSRHACAQASAEYHPHDPTGSSSCRPHAPATPPPCHPRDSGDPGSSVPNPGSDSIVWSRLQRRLALNAFDRAVLLLALAPEADLKYETIYAYLNNDVTRKWPTRDLALRLFSHLSGATGNARARLGANAPPFQSGLLQPLPSTADHPTWRASGFVINAMVAHALLDAVPCDAHLPPGCVFTSPKPSRQNENGYPVLDNVPTSDTIKTRLARLPGLFVDASTRSSSFPLLVFEGRPGTEQHSAALSFASALGAATITVDMRRISPSADRLPDLIRSALLHQLLYGSVLVIEGLDTIRDRDSASADSVRGIVSSLSTAHGPVIIICDESAGRDLVDGHRAVTLRFDLPSSAQRATLWDDAATQQHLPLPSELRDTVASRFILTPGQIDRAAEAAADDHRLSSDPANPADTTNPAVALDANRLFEAARTQTRIALGSLARRVNCAFSYDDLILPDVTAQQIREISAAIRSRGLVYEDWDFARRLPQGQGLKVLFSGASGTGKTMAAAVIAREVGLDLYAIDLSGIVSKYIGETEKNLDRVFRAAHCSNAILLFDECDALFGKRSEVKDAHDRYANIEVAYLLQKMEAHEGAVILATNFSRNMDLAFARRMQYVVEFPIPDEPNRERLWRGMFPERTPLSDDVDFPFLARHFSLAGGDIRNVALDAAFLAAQNGRVITMQHLVRAMGRQVIKQGRSPSPTDFKHYFTLLSRDS